MSQKKVDYYKQAKANRKREERKKNFRKTLDYTIRRMDRMVRL